MELTYNGNKYVVSVNGQRAATVYCVDYVAGRYDVVFNDDVVEQNPLPIFEQLLIDGKNRIPTIDSHEANTWRLTVPDAVVDLNRLAVRHVDGNIELIDGDRVVIRAIRANDDTYMLEASRPSELDFAIYLSEMTKEFFSGLFPERHVNLDMNKLSLCFKGKVADYPMDMFHVNHVGHGEFQLTSTAGRVGDMREFALSGGHTSAIGVEFVSFNYNEFPVEFCNAIYKQATGYDLGHRVSEVPLRFEVVTHSYVTLTGIETITTAILTDQGPDNALIAIRDILPSVILTVNEKPYVVMPVFVDPRDTRDTCVGDVYYLGKSIGKGLVLPRGYLCMEATDGVCEIFTPISTKGPSAIPVATILDAFLEASDVRDELRISPFAPSAERRGDGRRDRGLTRRSDVGRSRSR
jgi:hypothetical protein